MNGFTFNGTTSQSLGLLVTALNPYNSASRRVETIEIPYRNGNLIIDSGTYDNIMVSYEVSVIGNTKATCDAVNEWLSGSQGYCILSDTVNTEFFRVGYFASSIEYVMTALYRYGKATINFDCFPQKYLNSNTTITRSATSTTTTDEGGTFSSKVYPLPIDLKGNTTQSSTPTPTSPIPVNVVSGDNEINICGKNLFDKDNIVSGYRLDGSGNPSSPASNEFTSGFILVESGATYIRSYGSISAYTRTCFYDRDKSFVSKNDDSQSFTIPSNVKYIRFSEFLTRLDTMQLEKGSSATTYEPYQGANYQVNLGVENLIDINSSSFSTQTINGVTITNNADGSFTLNGTSTGAVSLRVSSIVNNLVVGTYTYSPNNSGTLTGGNAISIIYGKNANSSPVSLLSSGNTTPSTFTTTAKYDESYLYLYVADGRTFTDYIFKPQLERGTKANTFQPYGTTPIELNKIGDYQDYIYKNGSKWYLHKEIGKVILNGSEDIAREQIANNHYKFYIQNISNVDYGDTNYIPKIMSDKLVAVSRSTLYINTQGITSANNNLQIYTDDTKDMVISEFRTWLESNNIIAYYGITTPTNTEITDATLISQLNALDSAMAFETSTTIAQVNNDAPFLLTYTNIGSSNYSSNYRGEPIITVNDTGYIYINGVSIKVNQVPMTINSQTMQAYNGTVNLNNYVELNEFPMLKKGNNDIGSTMALSIVPNYWKL